MQLRELRILACRGILPAVISFTTTLTINAASSASPGGTKDLSHICPRGGFDNDLLVGTTVCAIFSE
jgi:hypothetical protein